MLLAGAGGHALELVDILIENGHLLKDLAFYNDVTELKISEIRGIKLITSLKEAESWLKTNNNFALATGTPNVRKLLFEKLIGVGGNLVSIIASSSIISRQNVKMNAGLNIMNFCMISGNVTIGTGTLINAYNSIHHDVVIGNFTEIAPGCKILGGVEIGDYCFIGSGAVVLPNVKIGSGSKVGAGAVVTKNVEPGATAIGVPAKTLKKI